MSRFISSFLKRFSPHGGAIDVIRDPYKAWFRLCMVFLLVLIVAIAIDGYIFLQLRAGKLVPAAASVQVPPPIIDEGVLTATAHAYAGRAAALSAESAGAGSTTLVVDPSR